MEADNTASLLAFTTAAVANGYISSDERDRLCRSNATEALAAILTSGCTVVIHGLTGATELNGQCGRVAQPRLADGGRWPVMVYDTENVDERQPPKLRALKLANLKLFEPTNMEDGAAIAFYYTRSDMDDAGVSEAATQGPSEVADTDMCRVCMCDANEVKLLRPCACRGSLAFCCSDCVVRTAISAWENGNPDPLTCKQCQETYTPDFRAAISREQERYAAKKLAEAESARELQRAGSRAQSDLDAMEQEVRSWRVIMQQRQHHLHAVALLEYGRWLGHAVPSGRDALQEAESWAEAHLADAGEWMISGRVDDLATEADDDVDIGMAYVHNVSILMALAESRRYARKYAAAIETARLCYGELKAALEKARDRELRKELTLLLDDCSSNLGNALVSAGADRLEEAEPLLREALEISRTEGGWAERRGHESLARCLARCGEVRKLIEAEGLLRWSWRERGRKFGRTHVECLAAKSMLDTVRAKLCHVAFADAIRVVCGE